MVRQRWKLFLFFMLTPLFALPGQTWSQNRDNDPKAVVGTIRNAPSRAPHSQPSNRDSSTQSSRGGIFQQFKSFTSGIIGKDDEQAERNEPPHEARNRKIFEPAKRVFQRNQAAQQRGMPSPPPFDPPSLNEASLPPIESARDRTAPSSADGASDFVAEQPSVPASTQSSSRRQIERNDRGTESESIKRNLSSASKGTGSSMNETNNSSRETDETEFQSVKRKPIPSASTSAPKPVSTNAKSNPPAPQLIEEEAPKPLPSSEVNALPAIPVQQDSLPTQRLPVGVESPKSGILNMALPHINVTMDGPPSLQIHQHTTYQVIASNQDQATLNGLIVRIGVPKTIEVKPSQPQGSEVSLETEEDGSTSVIWQLGQLAAGESQLLHITLLAIRPEHFAIDMEWTALPQTGQVKLQVQQPQLQLAVEGPSEATYGKPEMYRLRIKNPGNADVKDVVVTMQADSEAESSTPIGDVPAGGERLIEVELTFQQPGKMLIAASAKSASMQLQTQSQIEVQVQQATLEARWNAPLQHYQGSVETYELTLINTSSYAAENIECKVTFPESVTPVSVPQEFSRERKSLTWRIAKLAPGATMVYPVQYEISQTGEYSILFQANGSAGATAAAETKALVEAISDLKLSVIDPIAPAPIGKPVTYELIVVNRGSKPASGVRVIAQFSNGIEPTKASGHRFQLVPGQVLFDAIESIGPGEERKLLITAQASEAGTHRFRAEVTCDDSDTQLLHEESTRYLATGRVDTQNNVMRR